MVVLQDQQSDYDKEVTEVMDDSISYFIQIDDSEEQGKHTGNKESFSHFATAESEEGPAAFTARLQKVLFFHAKTANPPEKVSGHRFEGVLVDTGAALGSSAGAVHYNSHCKFAGQNSNIDESCSAVCHFGIRSAASLGMASITFPHGSFLLSFDVHVVDADTPILVSIYDMDLLRFYFNNLDDTLLHPLSGLNSLIKRTVGHSFIHWSFHVFSNNNRATQTSSTFWSPFHG